MRRLPVALFFALTIGVRTVAHASAADAIESAGLDCPSLVSIEAADDDHYFVTFGSHAKIVASSSLRFFARDGDYTVSLPAVDIGTDSEGTWPFASRSFALVKTSGARITALTMQSIVATTGEVCPASGQDVRPLVAGPSKHKKPTDDNDQTVAMVAAPATKFSCKDPFVDAMTDRVSQPAYPASAVAAGIAGFVTVFVSLDENGHVTDSAIFRSSGSAILDRAAEDAALRTTYHPKIDFCKSVNGTYLFTADFSGS